MKKFTYLIGLILPGIAVKAIAQEIHPHITINLNPDIINDITNIDLRIIAEYRAGNTDARKAIIKSELKKKKWEANTAINDIAVDKIAEQIISLSEERQERVLEHILVNRGSIWSRSGGNHSISCF